MRGGKCIPKGTARKSQSLGGLPASRLDFPSLPPVAKGMIIYGRSVIYFRFSKLYVENVTCRPRNHKNVTRAPVCGVALVFCWGKEKKHQCRAVLRRGQRTQVNRQTGRRMRCEVNNGEMCGGTIVASGRTVRSADQMCGSAFCVRAAAGLATLHGSENLFTTYIQPVADVWVAVVGGGGGGGRLLVVVSTSKAGYLIENARERSPITIARAIICLSSFCKSDCNCCILLAAPYNVARGGLGKSDCGEIKAVTGSCILLFAHIEIFEPTCERLLSIGRSICIWNSLIGAKFTGDRRRGRGGAKGGSVVAGR